MSDKVAFIDQMHNAADDRGRADILLRCPDAIVLKYETAFLNACREFPAGELFVLQRTVAMRHVRSAAGGLPGKLALMLETLRAELTAYAAGAPIQFQPDGEFQSAAPEWPLDAPQQAPPSIDI